eukprot:3657512-Rhodomonas_salina.2
MPRTGIGRCCAVSGTGVGYAARTNTESDAILLRGSFAMSGLAPDLLLPCRDRYAFATRSPVLTTTTLLPGRGAGAARKGPGLPQVVPPPLSAYAHATRCQVLRDCTLLSA